MKRYGLRDDQFARIELLLPGRRGTVGRNSELGNRVFVEAAIWKFRSGAPWRDLPERFGGWKNTHKRLSRWAASGVCENLFKALAADRKPLRRRPCRRRPAQRPHFLPTKQRPQERAHSYAFG